MGKSRCHHDLLDLKSQLRTMTSPITLFKVGISARIDYTMYMFVIEYKILSAPVCLLQRQDHRQAIRYP